MCFHIVVCHPLAGIHKSIHSNAHSGAAQGQGRAEENVVGDDFTAPDKVKAPKVSMCRIDYQTHGAILQPTSLTYS